MINRRHLVQALAALGGGLGLTPPASESQAMDTVRQVEALVKGEVPSGAVNVASWTRRA